MGITIAPSHDVLPLSMRSNRVIRSGLYQIEVGMEGQSGFRSGVGVNINRGLILLLWLLDWHLVLWAVSIVAWPVHGHVP